MSGVWLDQTLGPSPQLGGGAKGLCNLAGNNLPPPSQSRPSHCDREGRERSARQIVVAVRLARVDWLLELAVRLEEALHRLPGPRVVVACLAARTLPERDRCLEHGQGIGGGARIVQSWHVFLADVDR